MLQCQGEITGCETCCRLPITLAIQLKFTPYLFQLGISMLQAIYGMVCIYNNWRLACGIILVLCGIEL